MSHKSRKPKPWGMGRIRVRAVRGPKEGRWYWRAELYCDGQSSTVWRGWGTRDEVERIIGGLVADGLDKPRDGERRDDSVVTVRDLLEIYVGATEDRMDISPNTKSISRVSGGHIVRHIGPVMLSRLGMREMELLRDGRLHEGAATQTTQHDIDILRRAWNWARSRGLCPDHRLEKPLLEVHATREKYTPSRDEFWMVVDHMEGWPRTLLEILGGTGARVSEGAALRWQDIDFERSQIRIREKKMRSKTGYRETVLPAPLAQTLLDLGPGLPSHRILPVTVDTARTAISQRHLKPTCEKLGVHYFTPHGIRRMVIDQLYESGIDVGTVAKMVGQSPKIALIYYRQPRQSDMERAANLAGLGKRSESNQINFEKRLKKDA